MTCSSLNFDRFIVRSSCSAGPWHQMAEIPGVRARRAAVVAPGNKREPVATAAALEEARQKIG